MFSQTGKLVSAEVKTDSNANALAKAKFNKTHGYQDNQFIIQNLKQTQNLSSSITNALLVEDVQDGSAVEEEPEHTRNKVIHTTVSDSVSRRGIARLAS